jgi:tRNA (cytidine32/guanosine34-2'-O)-methyltransferase
MGRFLKDKVDRYYRQAKVVGFRARSAYKLLQIDEAFDIFRGVRRAVDLCAAPGSWSQVLSKQLYGGASSDDVAIVAVDLQEMAPIEGVTQLQGDITSRATVSAISGLFRGHPADLVVCDGAPDVTGVHDIDCYMHTQLMLAALSITTFVLRPGGTFVAKVFAARDIDVLRAQLRVFFERVTIAKPKSSRPSSFEHFVVCQRYAPPAGYVPTLDAPAFVMHEAAGGSAGTEAVFAHPSASNRLCVPFIACGDLSGADAAARESGGQLLPVFAALSTEKDMASPASSSGASALVSDAVAAAASQRGATSVAPQPQGARSSWETSGHGGPLPSLAEYMAMVVGRESMRVQSRKE